MFTAQMVRGQLQRGILTYLRLEAAQAQENHGTKSHLPLILL
jgi:hypothetical protein